MCKQHTSSGVHPVNRHRRLEQALVRLEFLKGISGASSICDDAASLSRSKIFEDAGQLVGSGSGLLYVYMTRVSVVVLSSKFQNFIPIALPHTKSEVCPLQLALLGVVSCLVDGSSLGGIRRGLLQEGVGADRGWRFRVVKECDDILLSGLLQQETVSNVSLELHFIASSDQARRVTKPAQQDL